MVTLDLQPNEGIVLQKENVRRKMPKGTSTGDLVLTNMNLYHATKKGTFRPTTEVISFPVSQIKVINGQAQALLGGNSSTPTLQILLRNGQEEFSFSDAAFPFQAKKEIQEWIEKISQVLGAEVAKSAERNNVKVIPGTKELAGTLKGTVGAFKDTMGIQSRKVNPTTNVTRKCIGCMAPLSGKIGQTVRCKYCDTEQTL